MATQPAELILARNLIAAISVAALLIDPEGVIVFFNDAAGELVGRRFEEVGPLQREEWNSEFGPFDEFGQVVPTHHQPATMARRTGLPTNGRVNVRLQGDELIEVDVSALPLITAAGFQGAVVVFWRTDRGDLG